MFRKYEILTKEDFLKKYHVEDSYIEILKNTETIIDAFELKKNSLLAGGFLRNILNRDFLDTTDVDIFFNIENLVYNNLEINFLDFLIFLLFASDRNKKFVDYMKKRLSKTIHCYKETNKILKEYFIESNTDENINLVEIFEIIETFDLIDDACIVKMTLPFEFFVINSLKKIAKKIEENKSNCSLTEKFIENYNKLLEEKISYSEISTSSKSEGITDKLNFEEKENKKKKEKEKEKFFRKMNYLFNTLRNFDIESVIVDNEKLQKIIEKINNSNTKNKYEKDRIKKLLVLYSSLKKINNLPSNVYKENYNYHSNLFSFKFDFDDKNIKSINVILSLDFIILKLLESFFVSDIYDKTFCSISKNIYFPSFAIDNRTYNHLTLEKFSDDISKIGYDFDVFFLHKNCEESNRLKIVKNTGIFEDVTEEEKEFLERIKISNISEDFNKITRFIKFACEGYSIDTSNNLNFSKYKDIHTIFISIMRRMSHIFHFNFVNDGLYGLDRIGRNEFLKNLTNKKLYMNEVFHDENFCDFSKIDGKFEESKEEKVEENFRNLISFVSKTKIDIDANLKEKMEKYRKSIEKYFFGKNKSLIKDNFKKSELEKITIKNFNEERFSFLRFHDSVTLVSLLSREFNFNQNEILKKHHKLYEKYKSYKKKMDDASWFFDLSEEKFFYNKIIEIEEKLFCINKIFSFPLDVLCLLILLENELLYSILNGKHVLYKTENFRLCLEKTLTVLYALNPHIDVPYYKLFNIVTTTLFPSIFYNRSYSFEICKINNNFYKKFLKENKLSDNQITEGIKKEIDEVLIEFLPSMIKIYDNVSVLLKYDDPEHHIYSIGIFDEKFHIYEVIRTHLQNSLKLQAKYRKNNNSKILSNVS